MNALSLSLGVVVDGSMLTESLQTHFRSLTGPTAGVFFGGWYIDRMGGYKDDTGAAAAGTLRRCTVFGALGKQYTQSNPNVPLMYPMIDPEVTQAVCRRLWRLDAC